MVDELFALFADPRLLQIVLCVGAIGVLRWISLSE